MSLILASVPASGALPLGRARLLHAAHTEARRLGARFVLAIDDTLLAGKGAPRQGSPPDDLAWLGLDWDDSFRRSGHTERYEAAAAELEKLGRLYPCFEHPDELRAKAERQRRNGRPVLYDRAMLRLTPAQREAAEAGGKRPHWRFLLTDNVLSWPDTRLGRCDIALPTMSDPILRDEEGRIDPALAQAADDRALAVTHIVSGEELLASTAIHLDLLDALGAARRTLTHLRAPADEDKRRLMGQSLHAMRQDGIAPAGLRAWFATLSKGRKPRAEIADLLAANRRALADIPFAEVAHMLPGVDEPRWLSLRGTVDLITEARLSDDDEA